MRIKQSCSDFQKDRTKIKAEIKTLCTTMAIIHCGGISWLKFHANS